jgi:predicted RNA-binding protein with PUA-like domain
MHYWLLKSEPDAYSIDDLKRQGVGAWDGVRNYMARNNLRAMKKGDLLFFYHSSTTVIGIAGIAEVEREAYPDPSQFKKAGKYYDAKATKAKPIWSAIDVRFKKKFKEAITLAVLKNDPVLADMILTQKGSRLSVQPVTESHFKHILKTYKV